MNIVSNERQKDLEKFTWAYVRGLEEEKIQLLEDSSIGKLSYFFFSIFFPEIVDIRYCPFCRMYKFCAQYTADVFFSV